MTDPQRVIAEGLAGAVAPCITSSFQADCVVLLHMLRMLRPGIAVLFLDTVHHFAQTCEYRDRLAERWRLNLVNLRAAAPVPGLWRQSTQDCCARHKVEPLFAALAAYDVWFTALRREQSPSRAGLAEIQDIELPGGKVLRKVSPLAGWTMADVLGYAKAHQIPLLPLYEQGYTSIGCEPCTALPREPGDQRSGRWGGEKLECGIHLHGPLASEPCRKGETR